ncbi:MAG: sulfite exporter TauE/SafE family protein, partial [Sandaracinaceae bacterium]|nr:sulfite exporter TauE/SafE family protein [Sandaracinaceae bacterium]
VFGIAGMIGAYGAGRVARYIPSGVLLALFGIMMLVTAVAMMRGRKVPKAGEAALKAMPEAVHLLPLHKVFAEGLVVGAVTGLVGAGGGFLVVPALVLIGGLPMDVAVGTSLVVIALKSFAGLAGYLGHAHVDIPTAGVVTASAVAGSVLGSWLAGRMSPESLRKGFAWFVVVMAFFVLGQELPRAFGSEPSIALVLIGTVLGTLLMAAMIRLFRLSSPAAT